MRDGVDQLPISRPSIQNGEVKISFMEVLQTVGLARSDFHCVPASSSRPPKASIFRRLELSFRRVLNHGRFGAGPLRKAMSTDSRTPAGIKTQRSEVVLRISGGRFCVPGA